MNTMNYITNDDVAVYQRVKSFLETNLQTEYPKPLRSNFKTRRAPTSLKIKKDQPLVYGDIVLCKNKRTALCNSQDLIFTKTEFNLLVFMFQTPERAIARNELLRSIWGDKPVDIRVVDDTVKRVRQRLATANSNVIITTVWGFGFRLSNKIKKLL